MHVRPTPLRRWGAFVPPAIRGSGCLARGAYLLLQVDHLCDLLGAGLVRRHGSTVTCRIWTTPSTESRTKNSPGLTRWPESF